MLKLNHDTSSLKVCVASLVLEIEKLKACEDTVLEIIADDEVTEDDLTVAMIEKHENSSATSNVNLVLNCENIDMSLES